MTRRDDPIAYSASNRDVLKPHPGDSPQLNYLTSPKRLQSFCQNESVRIALDATYSVDGQPSGIAVYSRRLLDGLAAAHPDDSFLHCYRPKQFRSAPKPDVPNVRRRMLLPFHLPLGADIFHALNQRVDRRYAARVATTFHDLFVMTGEYSTPEFRRRFTERARQAAQRSDLIITVSQFTADQVHQLLGVERARIRAIPHGVDSPASIDDSRREPLVLFVGALQVRKNIARLVEAFESLPAPWRLVLAGAPTGHGAPEILARIERSAARERIEVAGHISDARLRELYARASIFAFPSLDEGFGIPVLEAMAWGVPVITSNSSALVEVAGDAALLVDSRETEAIAASLHRLTTDGDLRTQLTQAGRLRAAEFSWKNTVAKTYSVYRELVGA